MRMLLLVRHGQGAFGSRDYDSLTELGHQQGRLLGESLAARGIRPDLVLSGSLRRDRQTVEELAAGGGWDLGPTGATGVDLDLGWNEFDHENVLSVADPARPDAAALRLRFAGRPNADAAFRTYFDAALARWAAGQHDEEYDESFGAFLTRVDRTFDRTVARFGDPDAPDSGPEVILVVTSGGPIAATQARLLGGHLDTWPLLKQVCVNTGVTKVLLGPDGPVPVTFNEHAHLEHDRALLTYR